LSIPNKRKITHLGYSMANWGGLELINQWLKGDKYGNSWSCREAAVSAALEDNV
jgi:hypothetical protein